MDIFTPSALASAGTDATWEMLRVFIAESLAHAQIGTLAALAVFFWGWPHKLILAGAALIVAKELMLDLPSGHWMPFVVIDSAWDLASYTFGGWIVVVSTGVISAEART